MEASYHERLGPSFLEDCGQVVTYPRVHAGGCFYSGRFLLLLASIFFHKRPLGVMYFNYINIFSNFF